MTLQTSGVSISHSEVTSIAATGFWFLVEDAEYFVPLDDYPEFKKATVEQIYHFQQRGDQFHWPALDVDIDLAALKEPERFPLKFT